MGMAMRDPTTQAEWQMAVDVAAGLRAIADCKMYGLIKGGPGIDVARCDQILELGASLQVHPSRPTKDLALEMVRSLNQEARRQTCKS